MIHWNADPEILSIGPLSIRWYGLMFLIGFSAGYQFMKQIFFSRGWKIEKLDQLLVHAVFGTLIGARLGHVLFYDPDYFLSHPSEIIKVWQGGLASHGGGLGLILSLWLYIRKNPDVDFLWLLDRMSIPTLWTAGLIRIGNLMNSEIIGHPTNGPWAVVFQRVDPLPRHPVQVYESLAYFLVCLVTYFVYKRNPNPKPGLLLGICFVGIMTLRFPIEFLKERQESFDLPIPLNMGQLLSLPFLLMGLYLVFRRPPEPGNRT